MATLPRLAPLAAAATDVRCLARRRGVRAALETVVRGVADGYAREELHVLVKRLDDIPPVAGEPRLELSDLGPESLPELAALNRARCDTRADHRFAGNLQRQYHGFIAHENGTLVGYYWWLDAAADHDHLAQLGLELGPGDVYGFDFFLGEAHRGQGRAIEFLYGVETRLRERGFERLWGYVTQSNTPARWLYATRGYEVTETLTRRRAAMR
jgi:GNAT superfamily N-acetyltransferase